MPKFLDRAIELLDEYIEAPFGLQAGIIVVAAIAALIICASGQKLLTLL